PSRMARQNASFPIPFGLTTPIPVMTTRGSMGEFNPVRDGMASALKPIQMRTPADGIIRPMPLGLYISVPFCKSKCSYCNFASDVFAGGRMQGYVDRLCSHIADAEAIAIEAGGKFEREVDSIYFGGGTPSLLEPAQLQQIFTAIRKRFDVAHDGEITVECAPGTLSDAVIDVLARGGVNRVSLGVQSFVDAEAR